MDFSSLDLTREVVGLLKSLHLKVKFCKPWKTQEDT